MSNRIYTKSVLLLFTTSCNILSVTFMPKKFFLSVSVSDLKEYLDLHVNKPISTLRSFFIEVVFLRWGGVFRLKHHLTPKKC